MKCVKHMDNEGKLKRQRQIWTVLTVAFIAFMYSNSLQVGNVSMRESGRVLTLTQDVLSSLGMDGSWLMDYMVRKTAHFGEYAVFGILLLRCVRLYSVDLHKRMLACALAGFVVPFVDETIQLFVEGRSGQISDVWLDCMGVACGILISLAISRLWNGKRGKKIEKEL